MNSGANAAPVSVQALIVSIHYSTAMAALKQTAIECLTLCLTRGMNGEILSLIVNLETIRLEDSGAA